MPKRQRSSESTAKDATQSKDTKETKDAGGIIVGQEEETKKGKEELDDLFGALAQGKRRKKQVTAAAAGRCGDQESAGRTNVSSSVDSIRKLRS